MSTASTADAHWATIARRWAHLGHPLRPDEADLEIVDRSVVRRAPDPVVLVLGATLELGARWPGARVVAVDHTEAMLRHLWAGGAGSAALGEWLALPVATASVDVAVCDGGLHLVDDLDRQRALLAEVGRVLRPGGRFVLRLFGRGEDREVETPAGVLAALARGAVPDAHQLKLRLWLALAGVDPAARPIAVADVWDLLVDAHPDLDALSARLGWPPGALASFSSYDGAPDRYWFVPFDHVVGWAVDDEGAFELVERTNGAGPIGDCCPTIVLERSG